ncbi:hypothetical protein V1509DRAFT_624856 [Lipomyces kononenkoae]
MMAICPSDPTVLSPVGRPVPVLGEFPNTVAVSMKNKLVCVGSTGAKAGISCATFSDVDGLSQMDYLRPFDLNQTTPPVGPFNTVSQTFFSEDESFLFTTVKGDPTVNKTASISSKGVSSSPPGTAVLFGSEQIPGTSSVFVADPSFGAAILSVDEKTERASLVSKQVIANQQATCWTTISTVTKSAFVTDPGLNRIVEMSLTNASIISAINVTVPASDGIIDLKAAGNYIYALSAGNQTEVVVLDISGGQGSGKVIQHLGLDNMEVGKSAQGMAVLM